MFRIADPAKVGQSLLDGNKDHLLSQAKSELMKQEHQVGSLNNCIDELNKNLCSKIGIGGRSPDLDENKFDYKKNYERKRSSRHSDSKYARDGRDEESSRTTSRRILCTKIERKS